MQACAELNWSGPTEIQREAIPHGLAGSDVIGLAETGSGKTGAFALPVLNALLRTDGAQKNLFCIVLAPTR